MLKTKFTLEFYQGTSRPLYYWIVGLPGTCLFFSGLLWTYIELSSLAYRHHHQIPDALIILPKTTMLSIGLSVALLPPLIIFYCFVYAGTARAALQNTGWASNLLWMGLGGHIAVTILTALIIVGISL